MNDNNKYNAHFTTISDQFSANCYFEVLNESEIVMTQNAN